MYKHILIPTDGTELGTLALKQGLAFAKGIGAKVTCMTAYPPFHTFTMEADFLADTPALYRKNAKAEAKKMLDHAAELAKTQAVPCDTVAVEHDYPYEAILNTARKQKCDLIAMASHGRRGLSAVVLGSETQKVLTHSTIPVLVYR